METREITCRQLDDRKLLDFNLLRILADFNRPKYRVLSILTYTVVR